MTKANSNSEEVLTADPGTEVAVHNQAGTQIAKASDASKMFYHANLDELNDENFPDLASMPTAPIDYAVQYWTPKPEGESRDVVFFELDHNYQSADPNTGETKTLPTAFFAWRDENGNIVKISNSTARLIAALENAKVRPGAGLTIQYLGKIKNKTNGYFSDNWRVLPKMYVKSKS